MLLTNWLCTRSTGGAQTAQRSDSESEGGHAKLAAYQPRKQRFPGQTPGMHLTHLAAMATGQGRGRGRAVGQRSAACSADAVGGARALRGAGGAPRALATWMTARPTAELAPFCTTEAPGRTSWNSSSMRTAVTGLRGGMGCTLPSGLCESYSS